MKTPTAVRILLLFVALVFGAAVVRAEDLGAIKARMSQRQNTVDALKDRKVVGEDNRGLLAPRGSLSADEQKLVSDENADRSAVYAAIAAQTGVSAEDVGRARAQKIAAASKPGLWIQSADGTWTEKH
jgi:uncharacterized protein YdbL (DUF1318 family)